jgi:hypothetical protein
MGDEFLAMSMDLSLQVQYMVVRYDGDGQWLIDKGMR